MPRKGLDVWLYGVRVARLTEPSRFRLRLDFTDDAFDTFGEGSRVLSLALPISRRPAKDGGVRAGHMVSAFIEGLLPEGNLRNHLATEAGVPVTDTMSLLEQVGAECAGAVQIVPEGTFPGDGHARRLTDDEVTRLVADLPTYHLPDGTTPQASLAGIQDKVLLVAMPDGGWGWPESGAASTHLIKPEPLSGAIAHLVQTENWALHVAGSADLPAARSRLETFDEREAIVVTRYDRTPTGDRHHQEDFCQALGLDPQAKYESTGEVGRLGSRLGRIARAAAPRSHEPEAFRIALLQAVTFNVVIGNGDAHSKNYSLLIDRDGSVSLAPIYDAAPVMHLDSRFKSTAHVINGKTNIDGIGVDDLAAEARSWGMSQKRADATIRSCMERVYAAAGAVALPSGAEQLRVNFEQLWRRRSWPV
ncbi:type II toxin-antitoxin system HipA family toxin [[Mycobacterium] appelbergii]|uniref:type II toxin-antitoxin system HipA family toxin n=1 Tax=[Mycobacterium] appelbergii TaxID=2939269 RepID=UPI0029391EA9|nr:HipA domain-containing protein [Mycobacterium sp. 21AC1]